MRYASAALISYLNSMGPTIQPQIADLVTIIQRDGTVTRLTNATTDLLSTSNAITLGDLTVYTFVSGPGITFSRGRAKWNIGLQVDNLSLTIMTDPGVATIGGLSWPNAARLGLFDGARIVVERLFMPTYGDYSLGTLIVFGGSAGNIVPSRNAVAMELVADINVLANPAPRNTFQTGCLHALYDSGCTLLQASFTVSGAVVAGGTASAFRTNLVNADGYFSLGAVTFTSGPMTGESYTVKDYQNTNGLVTPGIVLPVNPAAATTFTIYPGCDKSQDTCTNKFSNLTHFRGFPYIPTPETAG